LANTPSGTSLLDLNQARALEDGRFGAKRLVCRRLLRELMPMRPLLPAILSHGARRDHGHFDIRGFLMGFALSAMIGAAFYIILTAG
jgi:hypothetical protein